MNYNFLNYRIHKPKVKNNKNIDRNFLNNQNYILGKTEKKKLLNKFFVERHFKKIVVFFSKLNYVFTGANVTHIQVIVLLSIFFGFLLVFFSEILFILILMYLFFILFYINSINIHNKNVLTLKRFFLKDKEDGLSLSFVILIMTLMISPFIFFTHLSLYISIISFLGAYILGRTFLGRVKFFNLLLSIPIFIYNFIFLILSFIYTFVFRGLKGYIFLKNKPRSNILKKFEHIGSHKAENELYSIKKQNHFYKIIIRV